MSTKMETLYLMRLSQSRFLINEDVSNLENKNGPNGCARLPRTTVKESL